MDLARVRVEFVGVDPHLAHRGLHRFPRQFADFRQFGERGEGDIADIDLEEIAERGAVACSVERKEFFGRRCSL